MTDALMLADAPVTDPRTLIYDQVRRVLVARSSGQGAGEAMSGLLALVQPLKDKAYYERLGDVPAQTKKDPDGILWYTFEAVIELLSRKRLWTIPPRAVPEGEEFTEAL